MNISKDKVVISLYKTNTSENYGKQTACGHGKKLSKLKILKQS